MTLGYAGISQVQNQKHNEATLTDATSSKLKLLLLEKSLRKMKRQATKDSQFRKNILGFKEPFLEKETATHSSMLAWRIPYGQRSLAGYSSRGRQASAPTSDLAHSAHGGTSLVME